MCWRGSWARVSLHTYLQTNAMQTQCWGLWVAQGLAVHMSTNMIVRGMLKDASTRSLINMSDINPMCRVMSKQEEQWSGWLTPLIMFMLGASFSMLFCAVAAQVELEYKLLQRAHRWGTQQALMPSSNSPSIQTWFSRSNVQNLALWPPLRPTTCGFLHRGAARDGQ